MKNGRWTHRHLLDTDQLNVGDLATLLSLSSHYHKFNRLKERKSALLKGCTVILFFAENSTRTKTSFDIAAKRLSADTFSLGIAGSSINKGESLKDTALTLQAMNPDLIVIRHPQSGAASYLANLSHCGIVNAGDGWHAHPSQALLDLFSLNEAWQGDFSNRTLLILGDIAHSRVARSNIILLHKLGVRLRLCGPGTLLPPGLSSWPVELAPSLAEALEGVDAVMCLRLQLERQQAGLLPSLSEYSSRFCLTPALLRAAKPDCKILHPGPMNRGIEISGELADSPNCLALNQVEAGVAMRMAILHLLLQAQGRVPC